MNLIDYHLRLDTPPADQAAILATLKALAEKYPGGPENKPRLRVIELGHPIGQCFRCGGLVCEALHTLLGSVLNCDECGRTSEDAVARSVPK